MDHCINRRWRGRLAGQYGYESRCLDGYFLEYRSRLHRLGGGNLIANQFGWAGSVQEFSIQGLIIAFIGAVVLLAIANLIQRGRVR